MWPSGTTSGASASALVAQRSQKVARAINGCSSCCRQHKCDKSLQLGNHSTRPQPQPLLATVARTMHSMRAPAVLHEGTWAQICSVCLPSNSKAALVWPALGPVQGTPLRMSSPRRCVLLPAAVARAYAVLAPEPDCASVYYMWQAVPAPTPFAGLLNSQLRPWHAPVTMSAARGRGCGPPCRRQAREISQLAKVIPG